MSRTARLSLSREPLDTEQPSIIFNETIEWLESGYAEFIKKSISSGMSLTIPAGYQYIVYGDYAVIGEIEIIGELVIL